MGFTLKGLFQGGLKGLGDSAKDIIAQVAENKMTVAEAAILVDKEINRHEEAMADKANESYKLELAEIANSRETNVRVQESEKASWLAKNVGYILDLVITASFLGTILIIVYTVIPESNKEIFYTITGVLGAKFGDIVGWHRGSSKGSSDKQSFLDKMMRK